MKPSFQVLALILLATIHTVNCSRDRFEQSRRLIDRGLYQEAADQLQQTLAKNPESQEAHYLLGIATSHFNRDKAVDAFQKSLLLNPKHANSLFALGFLTGDRSYYDKVLSIDPKHRGALWLLCNDRLKRGQRDDAMNFFQQLIKASAIEKEFFKPHIVEEKQKTSGYFIVLADSTLVYEMEGNSVIGSLRRYDIKLFAQDVNDRYVFIERIPSWKKAEGWIYDGTWDNAVRDLQGNEGTWFNTKRIQPPESAQVFTSMVKDLKVPAYPSLQEIAGNPLDRNLIRPGSIQLNGQKRQYDGSRQIGGFQHLRYMYFSGVTFDLVDSYKELTRSVLKRDCTPGSGDMYVDKDRIGIVKEFQFWPKDLTNNILSGQISKGMTLEMVLAALGERIIVETPKWGLYPEGLKTEIKLSDLELKFVDGRLREWTSM